MAVGGLILATVIYELYVSTQVQKLKLAAKSNFTTVCLQFYPLPPPFFCCND